MTTGTVLEPTLLLQVTALFSRLHELPQQPFHNHLMRLCQSRHVICVCAWALTGLLMVAEPIQPRLAPNNFQSSIKYSFNKVIKKQCTLSDTSSQGLIRDTSGQYLMAAALQDTNQAGKETIQSSSLTLISLLLSSFLLSKNKPLYIPGSHNSSKDRRMQVIPAETPVRAGPNLDATLGHPALRANTTPCGFLMLSFPLGSQPFLPSVSKRRKLSLGNSNGSHQVT